MVATVAPSGPGEIVDAVTSGTGPFGDGIYSWPIDWILQHGRVDSTDMAIAALVFMYRHRVVRRMTSDTERSV